MTEIIERALTSLKYFCEDAPEYYVIGAGSLLGVAIKRDDFSFPVGKVLVPMDFEEFLWAKNQDMLVDEIKMHYEKRALTENYVVNALTQKGYPLYYWTSGTSEVDFMIEKQSDVFPIEVKSRENVKHYHPDYSIRISGKNFGFENNILSIPLYAVFCL